MTWDKSSFVPGSLKEVDASPVQIGNGQRLPVTAVGDVTITLLCKGYPVPLTLRDVRLVPDLGFKLLSMSSLTANGCTVTASDSWLKVFKNDALKFVARRDPTCSNLYRLLLDDRDYPDSFASSPAEPAALASTNNVSPDGTATLFEWHLRLGHRSHKDILKMWRQTLVRGMEITDTSWPGCHACDLAKISHSPIPSLSPDSDSASTSPGTLVTDLLDYGEPDRSGNRYASIVTDIYSRYSFVRLLPSKSAQLVSDHLEHVIHLVSNETGHRVRSILSDNGLEYDNDIVTKMLSKHGVRNTTSRTRLHY